MHMGNGDLVHGAVVTTPKVTPSVAVCAGGGDLVDGVDDCGVVGHHSGGVDGLVGGAGHRDVLRGELGLGGRRGGMGEAVINNQLAVLCLLSSSSFIFIYQFFSITMPYTSSSLTW